MVSSKECKSVKSEQWLTTYRLIAHDRHDEALVILRQLHTNNGKLDMGEDELNREAAEIRQTVDEEREAAAGNSYMTLLRDGKQKFRYRTLLGMGGQFMQQLSGELDLETSCVPRLWPVQRTKTNLNRYQPYHLLCAINLPEICRTLPAHFTSACRLHRCRLFRLVASANLDLGSSWAPQADVVRGRRNVLLYVCTGWNRLERQHCFRRRCFCDAVFVQLLLRGGYAGHSMAVAL